jgi:hypothetical protein
MSVNDNHIVPIGCNDFNKLRVSGESPTPHGMRVVRKATFKRLRQIREDLGLEVAVIAAKLGGKPSVASIYRLEQGQAIRVAHARRVFDIVNADGKLKPEDELVDET